MLDTFIFRGLMKKKNRILKSEEFTKIIKGHHFYRGKGMVLYVYPRQNDYARVGISVKKKTGNAVVRNLCKRQIRMICQETYDFNEEFDSIILIKEDFIESNYKNNQITFKKLYKKVKMD